MGAPGKLHKLPPAQALAAKGFFAGGKGTGKKARPPFLAARQAARARASFRHSLPCFGIE